jgi:hypothetical protein
MKKVFLLLLFLCVPILAFSEEEDVITQYVSPSESSATGVDSKLNAEIIAVSTEYSDFFLAYDALRENNPFLCGSSKACNNIAEGGFSIKIPAEGRCDEIKDPVRRGECEDFKNNCKNVSGWKGEYCRACITNDVDGLSNIFNTPEAKKDFGENVPTKDAIIWRLAVASGFRHSSLESCQEIIANSSLPLIEKLVCNCVFSKTTDNNEIIRDLALLRLSRKENNIQYCDSIKLDLIKKECVKK